MHHHFSSEEPISSQKRSDSSSMVQARIEAYLNRTCAPLFLSLPHEEAVQQRAEMQSHLESLAAAYIELGASEIEAVTQALEQFGKEQSVAQAWKQECEETRAEAGRGTFWSAIRPAIKWTLLNRFLYPLLLAGYAYLSGYTPTYWMDIGHLGNIGMALVLMERLIFPIYLGFLVGRRVRGKILALSLPALPVLQR